MSPHRMDPGQKVTVTIALGAEIAALKVHDAERMKHEHDMEQLRLHHAHTNQSGYVHSH